MQLFLSGHATVWEVRCVTNQKRLRERRKLGT